MNVFWYILYTVRTHRLYVFVNYCKITARIMMNYKSITATLFKHLRIYCYKRCNQNYNIANFYNLLYGFKLDSNWIGIYGSCHKPFVVKLLNILLVFSFMLLVCQENHGHHRIKKSMKYCCCHYKNKHYKSKSGLNFRYESFVPVLDS